MNLVASSIVFTGNFNPIQATGLCNFCSVLFRFLKFNIDAIIFKMKEMVIMIVRIIGHL